MDQERNVTSEGASEPSRADARDGGAEVTAEAPAGGASPPAGADTAGGADPEAAKKKRRRGKRGGKRHRKKPAGTGEGAAATPDGDGDGEPRAARPARRPPAGAAEEAASEGGPAPAADAGAEVGEPPARQPRQRQPRPRAPRAPARDKPAATTAADGPVEADAAGEAAPANGAPSAEGAEAGNGEGGATGPKKRRRRGGRGRKRKPAGEGGSAEGAEAKPAAEKKEPAAKAAPASTRLQARQIRKKQMQQRGRRPQRRLTEEDVRRLRGGDKIMLVHEHEDRTQIAVLEEGALIEHYVARRGQKTSLAGSIFLGRVQNVLPGMEAAFVDFGRGRNGVLYAGEVNYSPEDLEGDANPRIEKVLKSGQALMVQVTKDPIGSKGARLTTQISLAGRYMVLAPEQQLTGISRRLTDSERTRLRQFLREMRPNGHGLIIRTAAEGASRESLEHDLTALLHTWESVQKAAKKAKAPHLLYEEPQLVTKVVRDEFSTDFIKLVVDTRGTYEDLKGYFEEHAPDLLARLELHQGALPLFEEYRVTEQLHKALERKVWLPSGGSIVIDRTEALTVIDVNTGKFTGKGTSLEDTVFKNNLEAAEEVARQLRLRDIGGIIVIDFIDMIDPRNQQEVLRTLKRALARDKTRSQVFEVSNLGLVEMTRKKVSEGLLDAFSEPCPNCEGRGIVLTHEID